MGFIRPSRVPLGYKSVVSTEVKQTGGGGNEQFRQET